MNGVSAAPNTRADGQVRSRVIIAILCFVAVYAAIGARLVQYGVANVDTDHYYSATDRSLASRPDIVDRNGDILATDIRVASLFGEPLTFFGMESMPREASTVTLSLLSSARITLSSPSVS